MGSLLRFKQAGGVLYTIKVKGRPVTAACNGRVGVRSVSTAQLYESARGVMFPMDSSSVKFYFHNMEENTLFACAAVNF